MKREPPGAGAPPLFRGTTRVVGVIGWPVEDSLSPVIHNAAFQALAIDWVYVPLPVPPDAIAEALAGLRALGLVGANVTMPHKTACAELIAGLSEDARLLGAVNTIEVRPEGLFGHNTDAPGFERFLREDAGFDATGRSALMFGAGGAARACALALARSGLAELTVAVREPDRAAALLETVSGFGMRVEVIPFDRAAEAPRNLVLNATPLGGSGEELPLPPLGPGVLAVDLRYRPSPTPFLRRAREAGAAASGGLGLLLQQAALSFRIWTGRRPPMDAMSAAALDELAAMAGGGPSAGP